MKHGKFITLEGGEGVGKTTNLNYIKTLLEQAGLSVVSTREPGGTFIAEKIRALLLEKNDEVLSEQAELLLIFAARAQHIKQVIIPALKQGQWVLCDRFTDASYAYQGGGRGVDTQLIAWLEQTVQGELRPDLTLLLDAPYETGMKRANQRGDLDRFEVEKRSFFDRTRTVYLQRALAYPGRIKKVNANQPLKQVQSEIKQTIEQLLNTR